MALTTFRGGIHIPEHKDTASVAIRTMPPPAILSIPLSQHIGAPCKPVVTVGERVLRGQCIGRVETGLGCPVHSPVSGTVTAIRSHHTATGVQILHVILENDGKMESVPFTPYPRDLSFAPKQEVIDRIREAGISGMGGAAFPTYAKLQAALGKAKTLIVNCAECEPYITANHRLLLENADAVLTGCSMLQKLLDIPQAIFAVEDNKQDAEAVVKNALGSSDSVRVVRLKTKYPQGDERQLLYALTGKELPAGKRPADLGCLILNAETCAAVCRALRDGMPLIERIVTVAGSCIKHPANLRISIGTSYGDVIDFCGGSTGKPAKLIAGGPMMGMAQWDLRAAVTKATSAILLLPLRESPKAAENAACIHCGRCISVCPMHLMPVFLARYAKEGRLSLCEQTALFSCVECGSCAYVCPASVPIVQYIRSAKEKLTSARLRQAEEPPKPPLPDPSPRLDEPNEKEEPLP